MMMNKRKPSEQNAPTDFTDAEGNGVAKLGPDIKAKIGQQLRVMYAEVVVQGIPDRFVDILRGLDEPGHPDPSGHEGPKDDGGPTG